MSCPFIESNNPQCSEHLSLQHLDEAYEFCSDHYFQCPLYMQMSLVQQNPVDTKVAALAK